MVQTTATRSDADGDTTTLTYVWKLNGVVRKTTTATSSLTDTIDLSTISPANGDTLSVEVTPNDGTGNGTMVSASATVNIPIVSATPESTANVGGTAVRAIVRVGNVVYLGGDFTQLTSPTGTVFPRQYLAAVDATTGQVLPWNPSADRPVYSLAASPDGTRIYAGGQFRFIGGQARTRLAAINPNTGAPLAWTPSVSADPRCDRRVG